MTSRIIVKWLWGLPGVFLTLLFLFITWYWSISGECKTFVLTRAWSSLLWNAVFPFSDLNWIFKILTDLSVNCWMNLGTKGKGKAVADADLTTKEINQVLATSCNIFVKQETGYQRTRAVWNSSLLKSPGTDIKVPGCIHCLNILHEKQKKKKVRCHQVTNNLTFSLIMDLWTFTFSRIKRLTQRSFCYDFNILFSLEKGIILVSTKPWQPHCKHIRYTLIQKSHSFRLDGDEAYQLLDISRRHPNNLRPLWVSKQSRSYPKWWFLPQSKTVTADK